MRSNQPIAWFDTVYKDCAAVYAQLRTESRKMAADDVYNEIVQPILASIYHSLGRDLDKRAFYWELEDGIWQVDPQKPFNTQLANNYVNASGDSFILKEFMRNLASKTATIDNIEMIRKAYQLEHYLYQMKYVDVNYPEENEKWNDYKIRFGQLMKDITDLADSFTGETESFKEQFIAAVKPLDELYEIMPIRLPSTPHEAGEFGAFYTDLQYYPDWDKHWRMEQHPDVVVRFEDNTHKFVFWRGTNYIPHWITENGLWYNNEFHETWFSEGSAEPMSDKQCRYSHVRIIQSNPARAIVHWRYALNDVNYEIAWPDAFTKWGDWSDEYYYIYPDASSVRQATLHTSYSKENPIKPADDDGHEYQEGIVVYHPFTNPDDYLYLDALHVANMDGVSDKWSWEKHGEPTNPTPEGSNIALMNMRSDLKPYIISPEGCELSAYWGSQGGSHFRWRDHWPTTTEPTPGRDANGKQAAHGSFFHMFKVPIYEKDQFKRTRLMLHGVTDGSVEQLVPTAHAWLYPPAVKVLSGNLINIGYDRREKAYKFNDDGDPEKSYVLKIEASEEHPAIHPVIIIENCIWTSPQVSLDGKALKNGIDYSVGSEKELGFTQLVIWLNKEISQPSKIKIF